MHQRMLAELESLRKRTARFRKVALHLHSPLSWDWAKGKGDQEKNKKGQFEGDEGVKRFGAVVQQNLELACITDHMKCGMATHLSRLMLGNQAFVVVPGIEVNLRPGGALTFARLHLLVLLPEGSSEESFAQLFVGQDGIPAEDSNRDGQNEVRGVELDKWVQLAHKQNALCVAAHVDSGAGVRYLFRQTAKDTLRLFSEEDGVDLERANQVGEKLASYLLESGIDAVEVQNTKDAQYYNWIIGKDGKRRALAAVLSNDSHCVEDYERSDRVTYVKMTDLSFTGLRDAFLFPETRIRFKGNLPVTPSPVLRGITIEGDETSFFKDVTIAFAENLNCIIGARGAGKSTLVEALRYLWGYNRTLDEVGELKKSILELQKATLPGCVIKVAYRTCAGEERVLTTTYDVKQPYATKVYSAHGDYLEVADVEECGDFPLRLFGWSEIETLGRSPERQRELLDRLVRELSDVLKRRQSIYQELRGSQATVKKALEEVRIAFDKNDKLIRRFREFKADFDNLNTEEVKRLFGTLDLLAEKTKLLNKLRSNTEALATKISDPSDISLRDQLESTLEAGSSALREWWGSEEIHRLGVIATEESVRRLFSEALAVIKVFLGNLDERIKALGNEAEDVKKNLAEKFTGDASMQRIADLRANAGKRLDQAAGQRDEYLRRWSTLVCEIDRRLEIGARLAEVQNEIAGIRARKNNEVEEMLNRFLTEDMRVSIQFNAGGAIEKFSAKLKSLFGDRGNQVKKIRNVFLKHYNPITFSEVIFKDGWQRLVGLTGDSEETDQAFSETDIDFCKKKISPFERDDSADVPIVADQGSRLSELLLVQETPWDDEETILLDGAPVNEKSPGQRSSAMLPLIALAETTPLVIDQPEDNLDKKLIGGILAKVLAELKEKRQIIVCTHDPNILVGGDAEQVIVLEPESDRRGKVKAHGSIDNADIVETVVALLEGGAEAFEARRKRYATRGAVS